MINSQIDENNIYIKNCIFKFIKPIKYYFQFFMEKIKHFKYLIIIKWQYL